MKRPPPFFPGIAASARERWRQLEADPELAGPWRQLFMQVQSPRHVVSELLQNADDAGATEAWIRIDGDEFVFSHDGADFTSEQFASLCRFGFSNKRALHTIGFRGIGFKSTFSLGDRVEVLTPSLSVAFERHRFTEPVWLEHEETADGLTVIRVALKDAHRRADLVASFETWAADPLSLLFFRSVRHLDIDGNRIAWERLRSGPVNGSEWLRLEGSDGRTPVLRIRSDSEPFPENALAEIREERLLSDEQLVDFPPAAVDLVVGNHGGLHTVLPLGVVTDLPFAINAPFVPDPARIKIKDPAISATNRWLLDRAGALAAGSLRSWITSTSLPLEERARAYALLPAVDLDDASPAGVAASLVQASFDAELGSDRLLLVDDGSVVASKEAVLVPNELFAVWPDRDFLKTLGYRAASRHIRAEYRSRLRSRGFAEQLSQADVVAILASRPVPRPRSWDQLGVLWDYIAPALTNPYGTDARTLSIVPVRNRKSLLPAEHVARVAKSGPKEWGEDWLFVTRGVSVLDTDWITFLEQSSDRKDDERRRHGRLALLARLRLDQPTSIHALINRLAGTLDPGSPEMLREHVRLAQLAARAGSAVSKSFPFVTESGEVRRASDGVMLDDPALDASLPDDWRAAHVLHAGYTASFAACSSSEWHAWVDTPASRLERAPRLITEKRDIWWKGQFETAAREMGYSGSFRYAYDTNYGSYDIADFDFPDDLIAHAQAAGIEVDFWRSMTRLMLQSAPSTWNGERAATGTHWNRKGTPSTAFEVPAKWIRRLQRLGVLRDTHGNWREPHQLVRRTQESESVFDIEPVLDIRLDTEVARPLLDALGVRTAPLGPAVLLDRLRALSRATGAPVAEVDRLYRSLGLLLESVGEAHLEEVSDTFASESLILSADGVWVTSGEVSIRSDDGLLGAPIIRPSVADLSLWASVGVSEYPSIEAALLWLATLPSGRKLESGVESRVRAVCERDPERIWEESRHWPSIAGVWTEVPSFVYAATAQAWTSLFAHVRAITADLRNVPSSMIRRMPFAHLVPLEDVVEDELDAGVVTLGSDRPVPWMQALGTSLARTKLGDEATAQGIRSLGTRMSATIWRSVSRLSVTPYLDDNPVGTPRDADVAWREAVLYVASLSRPRQARRVPEELARPFGRADVRSAIDYAFEREPNDVLAYMRENFDLAEVDEGDLDSRASADVDAGANPDWPAQFGNDPAADSAPWDEVSESVDDAAQGIGGSDGPRRRRLTLIERFARLRGLAKNGRAFSDGEGGHLHPLEAMPGWWELIGGDGDVTRWLYPVDRSLDRGRLTIDAEAWALLERTPASRSLILVDGSGAPIELRGDELLRLRAEGTISVYPAAYRIVRERAELV